MNMRQLTAVLALALASACILVASCSRGTQNAAPTTTSSTPPPVAADVLYGLLLSPAEINTAMATTGILVNGTYTDMFDDSANIPDKDCRFIDPAETWVYDGSGWIAMRSQHLHEPGDDFDHEVLQAVVAFPSANDAARFFSASAQRGCAGLLESPIPQHRPRQARQGLDGGADRQHQRHPEHHRHSKGP